MDNLQEKILAGKIFVYPTDTVYGLGCNAMDKSAVQKIKEIKNREKDKPLSVIAPSLRWLEENLIVDYDIKKYLPGPYTLILKKKNINFLSWIASGETLGIRIPDSDFCKKIQESGVPFITTSVNLSGEPFANKISDIKQEILNKVDFIIDISELSGKPSTLIINGRVISRDQAKSCLSGIRDKEIKR